MTPEAARFLEKAHKLLAEAAAMQGINLHDAAGRTAYLAGFHAAQALIFERTGRTRKTHNGVQTEFLRLTRDGAEIEPTLRMFLSQAYNLKAIADYETGPTAEVSPERAADAIEAGRRFVTRIAETIGGR